MILFNQRYTINSNQISMLNTQIYNKSLIYVIIYYYLMDNIIHFRSPQN